MKTNVLKILQFNRFTHMCKCAQTQTHTHTDKSFSMKPNACFWYKEGW